MHRVYSYADFVYNYTGPQNYLQDHLNVVRVAFTLLVSTKLCAAVQKRGGHPRLVGVDRGRGDERGRGWAGRSDGAAVLCSDRHDER